MDPNETLARLRDWANPGAQYDDGEPLSWAQELFNALDDWLSRGGFLPEEWRTER